MNKFEAVILFTPDLSTSNLAKLEETVKNLIVKTKGKIISTEDWGLRDLSYVINSNKKAFYKFYQIEMMGKEIPGIKTILSQNEKILRYLFIKVEGHEELPTKLLKSENENK